MESQTRFLQEPRTTLPNIQVHGGLWWPKDEQTKQKSTITLTVELMVRLKNPNHSNSIKVHSNKVGIALKSISDLVSDSNNPSRFARWLPEFRQGKTCHASAP